MRIGRIGIGVVVLALAAGCNKQMEAAEDAGANTAHAESAVGDHPVHENSGPAPTEQVRANDAGVAMNSMGSGSARSAEAGSTTAIAGSVASSDAGSAGAAIAGAAAMGSAGLATDAGAGAGRIGMAADAGAMGPAANAKPAEVEISGTLTDAPKDADLRVFVNRTPCDKNAMPTSSFTSVGVKNGGKSSHFETEIFVPQGMISYVCAYASKAGKIVGFSAWPKQLVMKGAGEVVFADIVLPLNKR